MWTMVFRLDAETELCTADKLLAAIQDLWCQSRDRKLSREERARLTERIRGYAELYLKATGHGLRPSGRADR